MLEILFIFLMRRKIKDIVADRGLNPRIYVIIGAVLLLVGGACGFLLGWAETNKLSFNLYVYVLFGEALGAALAFYITGNIPRRSRRVGTQRTQIVKKLFKNPVSLLGLIILIGFILVAFLAPFIAPTDERYKDDPYRIPRYGWSSTPSPPSPEHPMGLAEGQYDIFYGLVWGTRTAFRVGIIVVGISCLVGLFIGSISAYFGGRTDEILMRITDIFMSFPFLIAAIVVTAILGKGLDKVMIAMIMFRWMGYARLIRGNILQAKEEDYIKAAHAAGVGHARILLRHLLPNTIYPVVIQASMTLGSIVVAASSLSFLGLGAPIGYADWGQMISFARGWILGVPGDPLKYWFTVVYPGAAIILFVLAWNLIGDAFRDIMDPKVQA